LKKYEEQEGKDFLVEFHKEKDTMRKYKLVRGDFLKGGEAKHSKGDALASSRSFIRHDPEKLAKAVILVTELAGYKGMSLDIV